VRDHRPAAPSAPRRNSRPDADARVVANAVAQPRAAGQRKRSCALPHPDSRDWATASAGRNGPTVRDADVGPAAKGILRVQSPGALPPDDDRSADNCDRSIEIPMVWHRAATMNHAIPLSP
jgi:hypothetical protein